MAVFRSCEQRIDLDRRAVTWKVWKYWGRQAVGQLSSCAVTPGRHAAGACSPRACAPSTSLPCPVERSEPEHSNQKKFLVREIQIIYPYLCFFFFFPFFFSFWDPCQWLCGFLFPWALDFSLCPGLCFPKAAAYSLCFHNHFAELEQILYFLAFTSPLQWQQFGNGPKLSLSHSYFNDLFIYFSLQTSQTSSQNSGDKDRKRSQDRGLEKWQYPWCG